MKKNIIFKIALCTLFGLSFLTSCTKKDSVTIEETTERFDKIFTISVDSVVIVNKVYATFCDSDTIDYYVIASREEFLDHPWESDGFEENDFVLRKDISETFVPVGKIFLGPSATPYPGDYRFHPNTTMNYTINNDVIQGTAEGILRGPFVNQEWHELPFTATYTAEIIPAFDCN